MAVRVNLNDISIHALLAESDSQWRTLASGTYGFLSTLSLRRATAAMGKPTLEIAYFYPRSPCGERHYFSGVMRQNPGISIHALLAESDVACIGGIVDNVGFLSTLSLRRATVACIGGIVDNVGFLSTLSLRRATRKVPILGIK